MCGRMGSSRNGTVGLLSLLSSSSTWCPPFTEHLLGPGSILGMLYLYSFQFPEADILHLAVEMGTLGSQGCHGSCLKSPAGF